MPYLILPDIYYQVLENIALVSIFIFSFPASVLVTYKFDIVRWKHAELIISFINKPNIYYEKDLVNDNVGIVFYGL